MHLIAKAVITETLYLVELVKPEISCEVEDILSYRLFHQFDNSTTPQLLNSTTHQLINSTIRQLLNSTTHQLINSTIRQLLNSSTHQLLNSSIPSVSFCTILNSLKNTLPMTRKMV